MSRWILSLSRIKSGLLWDSWYRLRQLFRTKFKLLSSFINSKIPIKLKTGYCFWSFVSRFLSLWVCSSLRITFEKVVCNCMKILPKKSKGFDFQTFGHFENSSKTKKTVNFWMKRLRNLWTTMTWKSEVTRSRSRVYCSCWKASLT